jgi:thioesterase domain-containing protein/acyl carrier protein
MVPQHFVFVPALPLTASGKVDAGALPVPDAARPSGEGEVVAPRDPLEAQLARIWEGILDVRPIGILDDFFELGGDSLLSVHLIMQIEERLGRSLPLAVLIEAPTIDKLARVLCDQNWAAPSSSLVALQAGTSRPPFFCVHGVGGNVVGYRDLARALGPDQPVYGLQAQGLDGARVPFNRLETMAAHYVNEIRRVQPEGPYYLGGLSFGGLVAFEMAQQLYAQGQNVGMLALFDSSVPGSFRPVGQRLLEHCARLHPLRPAEFLRYIGRAARSGWTKIKKRMRQARYMLELRAGRSSPSGPRSVSAANYLGRKRYTPRPYPGQVTLFRASPSKEIGLLDTEKKGWGELALGGVEVWEVPGDHVTLIQEPHVRVLGNQLRACLDKAMSASERS